MSGMVWIALEVTIPKIRFNIRLSLRVKKVYVFKFDGVAESDNTALQCLCQEALWTRGSRLKFRTNNYRNMDRDQRALWHRNTSTDESTEWKLMGFICNEECRSANYHVICKPVIPYSLPDFFATAIKSSSQIFHISKNINTNLTSSFCRSYTIL